MRHPPSWLCPAAASACSRNSRSYSQVLWQPARTPPSHRTPSRSSNCACCSLPLCPLPTSRAAPSCPLPSAPEPSLHVRMTTGISAALPATSPVLPHPSASVRAFDSDCNLAVALPVASFYIGPHTPSPIPCPCSAINNGVSATVCLLSAQPSLLLLHPCPPLAGLLR